MNKVIPDKSELENLYIVKGYSINKISTKLNMSVGKVHKYIKLYEIPTRDQKSTFTFKGHKHSENVCKNISNIHKNKVISEETKEKIKNSKMQKGVGHKKVRKDGYISIYFPDHPKSNKEGYIMEHDLVMECYIGRWLKDDEIVHHKNKKRNDNKIENLKLMTKSDHARFHAIERKKERNDDLSIRQF